MRLSQSAGRPSRSHEHRAAQPRAHTARARARALICAVDVLESRRLFSGETLSTAIPPVLANVASPSTNAVTLDQYFTNANLPGTLATFDTSLGTITVALTDAATPNTVANFLSYVSGGAYDNTIFHRTAVLSAGTGGSPSSPADIIQGGGYVVNGASINHIATKTPVDDEYKTELFGDVAGTLAMAKTSSANSATSEWYFNVHDNTSALDTPTTDSSGVTTSYTVFGKVLTGMNVVDEIASLPTYNYSSSLNTVPVVGLNENQAKANFPITAANLVYTDKITTQPGVSYTVSSDDPALVTPSVSNGVVSFKYASGLHGTADITVVAKSLDGSSASTTFAVTVPNTTTATTGPIVSAVTAPNVIAGKSGTFTVLTNDTDASAALNQSSVAISAQAADGTAVANASSGLITYTPNAGFTGTDTFSYTVTDSAGAVSSPALVTVNVVAAPATVTIGTASARMLNFTEPSGVVGHLKLTGGTGVVTFTGSAVTTTTSGGVVTATGADADIASIVITNTGAGASLSLTANGAVNLGTVTDSKRLAVLDAPNATLTGDSGFGSIDRLVVAGLADASLSLGSGATTLIIPGATDSTVSSTGSISSITSTQWLNDNGGYYTINTPRLGRLDNGGSFADVLDVTAAGSSIASVAVGAAQAAWTIAGSIGRATFSSPASTFSLTTTGKVGSLAVKGNLASNLTTGAIGTFTVTGTTTGSTINTGGGIGRLLFDGAVATTNVTATGGIGSVTAPSLGTSNVSAGLIGAVVVGGNAETAVFTTTGTAGKIGRFKVGGDFNTSSISAAGSIGPVSFASLTSSTLAASAIGSVLVSGASNGSSITTSGKAGAGLQIASVRIGGVFDSSSVSAAGRVGSFTALSLTGSQVTGSTLASVRIAGIANDGTFQSNANSAGGALGLGRLIFGGALQGTLISANGSIGSVTATSMTGSQIYAGVNSAESESAVLPANSSEFISKSHIDKVVLAKTGTAFSNSIISASVLGSVILGNVNTSNSSISEGLAANKIGSINAVLSPGGTLDVGPKELKSAAVLTAYETAKKITLGDFEVSLL